VQKTALAAGIRGELTEGERRRAFGGHSLRAGLASSAQIEEAHVQKHLGHASPEMTRRYQRKRDRFRVNLTKAAGCSWRTPPVPHLRRATSVTPAARMPQKRGFVVDQPRKVVGYSSPFSTTQTCRCSLSRSTPRMCRVISTPDNAKRRRRSPRRFAPSPGGSGMDGKDFGKLIAGLGDALAYAKKFRKAQARDNIASRSIARSSRKRVLGQA
jgi:hypothetical protein